DSASDPLSQNRRGAEEAHRTSTTGVPSNLRKASSTSNFVDDLSAIFRVASISAQFQEVEGEPKERQRARLEREQRESAGRKELAGSAISKRTGRKKRKYTDIFLFFPYLYQYFIYQEYKCKDGAYSKHGNTSIFWGRNGGTLDAEVKRWAAGKGGNLRALQSSVQYPACGWQPVSLIDLINDANVKKAYRKATLCIHPDKVQQKGAILQQKYVAEKVFDILKVLN
ncbi:auxilin-related protein 2-like protein, partial [Tanacetum coccineum]